MTVRSRRWLALLALIAVAAVVVVGVFAPTLRRRADPRPNVLIVLWDTVRADRLSPWNKQARTTPNLARWAEQAVVFEHAVSPAMWTVPSHASMFTGLMPTSHGTGMDHLWLDGHYQTMAEWYTEQGYATYAFSANPNLSPNRVNLLQGFGAVDVSWKGRWRKLAVANARAKLLPRDASTEISPAYRGRSPMEPQSMHWDAGPVAKVAFAQWLDQRPDQDKPWLAYLSYMEAHKPRIPSMEARRRVADDATIRTMLDTDLSFDSQLLYSYGQKSYSREELRAVNLVYDATLWDLDKATTELMAALEQRGELENTIVVFTADHGEQLGEHHLFGHRNAVYQSLLHVPLIVSWPGHLEPAREKGLVSTIDLFDSVSKLAGIPLPEGPRSGGDWFAGTPGAWGVMAEALDLDMAGWRRVNRLAGGLVDNPWARTFRTVYDGRWKLLQASDGEARLFDLKADPHERANVADREPDRVAALQELLEQRVASMPAWDPKTAETPVEDDAETVEALEVLGYIDGEDE